MNTIRMIAIALPMALLLACGGGGGSATAIAPTTNPPTTTPPTTGGPNMPDSVTLPGYAITNLEMARMRVGGTAPTATNTMDETAIVAEIQRIATAADTFEFSDFGPTANAVTINCSNKLCSGNVDDVGMLTFSLDDIEDLSLVDDTGLMDFRSETQAVMVDRGVTLIQSQVAARQEDGTRLSFQTYGGWLANSVFGVELLDVTENDTTTSRFASFSFGNASGSRPTGSDSPAIWTGSMIGMNTGKDIFQGDAEISIDLARSNTDIGTIRFNEIVNIKDGTSLGEMVWFYTTDSNPGRNAANISIGTDGTFSHTGSSTGHIEGTFYGTGGMEVGGTFNRDGIIGAFGATR